MIIEERPPCLRWWFRTSNHVFGDGGLRNLNVQLHEFTVNTGSAPSGVFTAHPTAEWTAQQMLEAFPFDTAPRYLLRDRDGIYGQEFRDQVTVMNIKEVLAAPRSPWQRAYVERVIGSIRRECLDHVIVLSEESLRRTLRSYFSYVIVRVFISR